MYLVPLVGTSSASLKSLHEKCSDDNVHRLAIPDLFINPAIRRQHSSQASDAFLGLEARVFWQAPVEILLDLIDS